MKPFISIIIPMFNSHLYIKKCVDSILSQTYHNFELIIINDGSNDGSLNIVKSFRDKRIRIINQKNKGVSSARNKGISLAKGSYIAFIDSDDYVESTFLESFVSIINFHDPDLIFCGIFSETYKSKTADMLNYTEKYYKKRSDFKNDIINLYDNHLLYNVWNKIFKKSLIDKFSIKFKNISFGEDAIFVQDYLVNCNSFYNINECLYHYVRENKSSVTTSYIPNLFNIRIAENALFINFFNKYGIDYSDYIDFISKRFIERTLGCLENIHRKNDLKFRDKFKEVDNIIHNPETIKYLNIYKTDNKKIKIILSTYRLKSPLFSYIIGYFLFLFKNVAPNFFNRIKNNR